MNGIFLFSYEKNNKLIEERGISFEEVIAAIENEQILNILEHPNKEKYSNQKIFEIFLNEYVYLVPFVIDMEGNIFLKTIIPSRKATAKYLKGSSKNEKK